MSKPVTSLLLLAAFASPSLHAIDRPIVFVTQVPLAGDASARQIGSAFGNQLPNVAAAPRGGDLMLRNVDGTLRNLTREAGFGETAVFQGANAIAVRDPAVSFDATRVLFSMVIGAPAQAGAEETAVWQLYEASGLGAGQTLQIVPVAHQPAGYNNIYPNYLSDGSVVFVSDRPPTGAAHLYPLRDEYRGDRTTSGVWKLAPDGTLTLLEHNPSGDFRPFVDSYGRLLFNRWDHLQQDANTTNAPGAFDYASEAPGAATGPGTDVFPEPFTAPPGSNQNNFEFNLFLPWMMNQDGSAAEVLNHLGRHELRPSARRTFTNNADLVDFVAVTSGRTNPNSISNLLLHSEHPLQAGRYLGVDTQEFDMHGAGQIVALNAPPSANADDIVIEYLSARATSATQANAANIGHFRDPLVLGSGETIAAFTATPGPSANAGTPTAPQPNYLFRLQQLTQAGGVLVPQTALTSGLQRQLSWFGPTQLVSYSGPLWELQPVELRSRAIPPVSGASGLQAPEQQVFDQAGIAFAGFQAFLRARGLGVIVVRNATTRDRADRQQPFKLRVPGGVQTPANTTGTVYDIAAMQYLQANLVRGAGTPEAALPGRRVRAEPLNDPAAVALNPSTSAIAPGAQTIFPDGSVALYVPARRALVWQSLSPTGAPVVRERYWVTLQPGEVRVCSGCHGANRFDQAQQAPATNAPLALVALLQAFGGLTLLKDGFE